MVKNLLTACLFTLPLLASANTLQLTVPSNSLKLSNHNAVYANNLLVHTGYKNSGRYDSSLINDDKASLVSVAYLAEESSANNKPKTEVNQNNSVAELKHTTHAVSVPSALPLLATAVGLFCFGANRRRV